jgi:hypothetical protein
MRNWQLIVCAALLLSLLPASASAQASLGRISVQVLDPQGAVIPGVEVVATNEETGVATKVQSNEAGICVLPFVQPGRYTIAAMRQGFKKYERRGLTVETAEVLRLDISMALGNVAEVIQVSAELPLLESSSASVGQFVDSRVVSQMPLSGRRALELARLAGGVVFVNYSNFAKPNFSLAGGRVQNQVFWLDGGNIQNMRLGVGQVDSDPPVEVIQEFRVVQNAYAAEYGGSAGGLIISTTKSGTNRFRGSVFEYLRNDKLDAPGFFAPTSGNQKLKAPLRYNLYGGVLGGPIIRDRTHFFAGYEGTRMTVGSTQILTVPSALQRQGDFSQTFDSRSRLIPIYDPTTTRTVGGQTVRDPFAGNIIPANRLDAVAKQLVAYWPQPNRPPADVAGAQNFVGNRAQKFNRDNVTTKVDHVFSDQNRFYFRLLYNRDPQFFTSNYPKLEADPSAANQDRWQQTYVFADTHTLSPSLVMDTRYTFGTRKNHAKGAGLGSKVIEQIGLRGVPSDAFPAISVSGIAGLGDSSERRQFPIRQHQVVNTWTWVRGRHSFKFGGEIRQSTNFEINRPIISGNYAFVTTGTGLPGNTSTGYGFASFLSGFVNAFSRRETDPLDRYSWYLAGFVQDDWKVSRSLTLNLGLRWETDTPITDKDSRLNSFDPRAINPVSGTPGVVRFAGVNGWPEQPYPTDWNNLGPRFGFAWRPANQEKWVLRGGYGVFYEHPFLHGAPNTASLGFEKSAALSSPDNGVTPAFYLGQGVPGATLGGATRDDSFGAVRVGQAVTTNVTYYEQNRRTGYAHQFSMGVQRQLPGNTVLEVSYMGNLGRKLPISNLNSNQVPPQLMASGNAQVRRPFPQFNNVTINFPTMGVNNYHAGVLRVEKRLSHGLNLLGTYTWARSIGNVDEAAGFGDDQIYQDYYNRRLDKGPSTIDIVQRFVWSSVYDLPMGRGRRWLQKGPASSIMGGWTVGSIVSMQSGGPFTVTMQTNTTNAFSAGGLRANLLRDPNLPPEERRIERWFDTEAFQAPPQFAFGNAGRGILRADGRVAFDFSINKNFTFGEKRYVQFRTELFNAINHPDFGPPAHSMGAAGFGSVTAATDSRTVQFGLRVVF